MRRQSPTPRACRILAAVACGLLAAAWRPAPATAGVESGDGVVRFVYADSAAQQVSLVGDFNGWSPTATPMDREGAVWATQVFMDPGTYEYKFLVDGDWRTDSDNPETSENGNSVVRVGPGGAVLPPAPTVAAGDTTQSGLAERLRWNVRYIGKMIARRSAGNYGLDRPLHDVDLRIDIDFGAPLAGWFLTNFNNFDEGVES
jgi:AMP-activated protein kinase-like protein